MRFFDSGSGLLLFSALMRNDSHKSRLADLERAAVLRGENRWPEIEELRLRIAEQGKRQSVSTAVFLFFIMAIPTLLLYLIVS